VATVSREVLGSAVEEVAPQPQPQQSPPVRSSVPLDRRPRPVGAAPGGPSDQEPPRDLRGGAAAARAWSQDRLDAVRVSRGRTAAALAVVGLLSGLVAVGVAEQVRQARLDAAAGVVAWLDYSSSGVGSTGQAVLRLNVVNTGGDAVTVTAADLEGGLDPGTASGVSLELTDELSVPPSGYATGTVEARIEDCSGGPVARGGTRDGDLRVTVAGADLRDEVLPGTRVGAFPISASTVIELGCGGEFEPTVLVQGTTVRADGRLYITLKGFSEDLEVGLTAPDGVELVTEPPSPVVVRGGEGVPMTTIAVDLQVSTCTISAQQLDAGDQVQLVVGEDRLPELDYAVVNAWVVREVARACG
jgi:hypothetical protein